MTSVAIQRRPGAVARPRAERVASALPLVSLYFVFCVLYATLAWLHPSPWLFSDELKYPSLARTIMESGTGTVRSEPQAFENLYVYLLAPMWWAWDTTVAYEASKYLGVLLMTSTLFPAYGLARTVVSRRPAFFAAAATVAIPSMFYSSLLAEETVAYPWATFCLYLFARALTTPTRWWIAGAVAAALVAPALRGQLAVLPFVFGVAALPFVWRNDRVRAWRATWSRWDWAGAGLLAVGTLLFFSELAGHLSPSWQLAVTHYKGRMLDYGLRALGGFTMGIGLLPVLAGIVVYARRPSAEPRPRAHLAFLSVLAATFLAFGWYTAVKAGYLSARFGWPRLLERNLVYLSPLLFVAVAIWLERPRAAWRTTVFATAAVAGLVLWTPDQSTYSIYSDAPGLSILAKARTVIGLGPTALEIAVLGIVAVSALLLLSPLVRRRAVVVGAVVASAALVLVWNLTAELAAASASNKFARDFRAYMPEPPNWVDLATGGAPAMYLGQGIADENKIFLLEFWNRTVKHVWSLDGSAPGPWAEVTPDLRGTRGELIPQPAGIEYLVVEEGVTPVGDVVERVGTWTLYRIERPLRLQQGVEGIDRDGWTRERSSYMQFHSEGGAPGFLTVAASRERWPGPPGSGRIEVRIGRLGLKDERPVIAGEPTVRRAAFGAGDQARFVLRAPPPPFRVEVRVWPTRRPDQYGGTDQRELGAQVRFSFTQG